MVRGVAVFKDILEPGNRMQLLGNMAADFQGFMEAMSAESIDLKSQGYRSAKLDEIIAELKGFYGIDT